MIVVFRCLALFVIWDAFCYRWRQRNSTHQRHLIIILLLIEIERHLYAHESGKGHVRGLFSPVKIQKVLVKFLPRQWLGLRALANENCREQKILPVLLTKRDSYYYYYYYLKTVISLANWSSHILYQRYPHIVIFSNHSRFVIKTLKRSQSYSRQCNFHL